MRSACALRFDLSHHPRPPAAAFAPSLSLFVSLSVSVGSSFMLDQDPPHARGSGDLSCPHKKISRKGLRFIPFCGLVWLMTLCSVLII